MTDHELIDALDHVINSSDALGIGLLLQARDRLIELTRPAPGGDRDNMLRAIDVQQWQTMLALADWHEENGEPQTAAGWRWLQEQRKRPVWNDDKRWWYWDHPPVAPHAEQSLPEPIEPLLETDRWPELSAAYEAAAKACGEWLTNPAAPASRGRTRNTSRKRSLALPATRYRPHSTYQCGEEVTGDWHDTLAAAVAQAIGWRGLPVGAGYGFWIEDEQGQTYHCCQTCVGNGYDPEADAPPHDHSPPCIACAGSGVTS